MIEAENEKERSALEKLKSQITDLKESDETFLRFLRARDYHAGRAEDMIRKSMKWRKDKNIESYLHWKPSDMLKEDFHYRFTGYDFEGRPVVWFPWGKYDGRVWVERGQKEELLKYIYCVLETVMDRLRQSKCSQVVAIFGMEELSMRKMAHLETMQFVYGACQEVEQNYPEIMKYVFIVNAPWIYSFGFNFIKPMMSSHTLAKLKIHSSDRSKFLPALLQKIPREAIPEEYLNEVP